MDCVEVSFLVTCKCTAPGQHVRVCGDVEELGCWDPEFAFALTTGADDYPLWRGGPIRVPPGFEYKYVVCTETGDAVQWEMRDNRFCDKSHSAMVFDETFDGLGDRERQRALSRSFMGYNTKLRGRSGSKLLTEADRGRTSQSLLPGTQVDGERYQSLSLLPDVEDQDDDEHPHVDPVALGDASPGRDPLGVPCTSMQREGSLGNVFQLAGELSDEAEISGCEDEWQRPPSVVVSAAAARMRFDSSGIMTQMYAYDGSVPIAEGTFARVWRVRNLSDNNVYAAKVIHMSTLTQLDERNLFGEDTENGRREGEIELHERLQHAKLVAMVEHFVTGDTVCLVLEYCPGGDLFDYILRRKGPGSGLPELDAAIGLRDMAQGLQFCHQLGVVHRDIKCENVLLAFADRTLQEGNMCKICDFGLATSVPPGGLQGELERVGSPDTVAPEIVKSVPYGTRADVWSTGVVLFMMLSAKAPFGGASDADILRCVRMGRYTLTSSPWPTISPEAKGLVRRVLVVEPAHRADMEEVLISPWLKHHLG
eukprot:CAMPEP_0204342220 /NCGR_PEP_ID=MMETSP0469-20131031/23977_1 /ASSEMBLY_ACC=CAM_ASM_000384 /TAXON_ID=2969 /ORGANISM="Oxyrrhis marina" /LENGTH=536 /DNA_ID=CAMNT_0051327087 /DNA_START=44 /DNA_END=1654 /DNA_ORIENTATION=-